MRGIIAHALFLMMLSGASLAGMVSCDNNNVHHVAEALKPYAKPYNRTKAQQFLNIVENKELMPQFMHDIKTSGLLALSRNRERGYSYFVELFRNYGDYITECCVSHCRLSRCYDARLRQEFADQVAAASRKRIKDLIDTYNMLDFVVVCYNSWSLLTELISIVRLFDDLSREQFALRPKKVTIIFIDSGYQDVCEYDMPSCLKQLATSCNFYKNVAVDLVHEIVWSMVDKSVQTIKASSCSTICPELPLWGSFLYGLNFLFNEIGIPRNTRVDIAAFDSVESYLATTRRHVNLRADLVMAADAAGPGMNGYIAADRDMLKLISLGLKNWGYFVDLKKWIKPCDDVSNPLHFVGHSKRLLLSGVKMMQHSGKYQFDSEVVAFDSLPDEIGCHVAELQTFYSYATASNAHQTAGHK